MQADLLVGWPLVDQVQNPWLWKFNLEFGKLAKLTSAVGDSASSSRRLGRSAVGDSATSSRRLDRRAADRPSAARVLSSSCPGCVFLNAGLLSANATGQVPKQRPELTIAVLPSTSPMPRCYPSTSVVIVKPDDRKGKAREVVHQARHQACNMCGAP